MQVKDEMKRQGWLLGGIKVGSRPAVAGHCESEGAGGKGTAVRKMECVFPLRPDVEVSASMDACVVLVHYGCGCCVCVLAHTSGMYLFLASDDVRARALCRGGPMTESYQTTGFSEVMAGFRYRKLGG